MNIQSLSDTQKILKKGHDNTDERMSFRLVFVDRARMCVGLPIKSQISGNTEADECRLSTYFGNNIFVV